MWKSFWKSLKIFFVWFFVTLAASDFAFSAMFTIAFRWLPLLFLFIGFWLFFCYYYYFFSIFGVVLPRRNVTGESSNCAPPVIESNEKMAGKVSGPLADPVPNSFWDTRNEFTEFFSCSNWFCSHLTGFLAWQWVWLALTGFDWLWLGLTGFDWVWLGLTGFYWVLLGFTGLYWVFLGFNEF